MNVAQPEYQIVGFHFNVKFSADWPSVDMKFQSVSGLDVQIEKETYKEGGENRFEHALPGRSKYSTLTLKRGIARAGASGLINWCKGYFDSNSRTVEETQDGVTTEKVVIKPLDTVDIQLLNEDHEVLMKWTLAHVWPVSWKVGELNAEKGEVLIETLELNYNRFKLENVE